MIRPLGLFIGAYLEEKQLPHLFRAGGSFANWNKAAIEVRVLPSHRNWEKGVSPSSLHFRDSF